MAKRDKLYTVNKWNKPFFEDDRRKRLYALGDRIIYGLKEGQGAERNSYGDVGGVDANVKMPSYLQKAFTSFNDYANPSHYQNLAKVNFAEGDDKPLYGSNITNDTSSTGTKSASLWSTAASGVANAAPDLVKAGIQYFNHPETGELMAYTPPDLSKGILKSSMVSIPNPDLKPFAAGVASKLPTAPSLAPTLSEHLGIDTAALTSEATKKAVGEASRKLVKQFPSHAAVKGKNFFSTNLGQGLALTAADLGGDYLRSLARKPELNDTTAARVGDVLSKAGTLVGTGLMATGYGLPVGLLALGVGKALGAFADQFGSKFIDKGARNRAAQLRGINTNGSDEYLRNLWAMVSPGEEDSYVRGIFAGSGDKNRAQANNEDMYNAVEDAQRNIRDAWRNNQFMRYQDALSNYGITAMGGKLNRRKCNKKATGGILNNSYIDTSSPSGYDIMMTALGNQEQKNQMQQSTSGSLGNSFISTPGMSTLYAKGGPMIKPENRGKLTELKKRTGKTEAELYNDGNPEHKKMVVFAQNSRRWHKHALGGYLKGKVYDIPEEEVQRLIKAGYEVEYL